VKYIKIHIYEYTERMFTSNRDATKPTPCSAPHYTTQERIMLSNPTPSMPRLSPAATMNDATPSALTPPLHCASILQSDTSSSCRFVVLDHLCSNLSQSFHPIPLPCALAFPPSSILIARVRERIGLRARVRERKLRG